MVKSRLFAFVGLSSFLTTNVLIGMAPVRAEQPSVTIGNSARSSAVWTAADFAKAKPMIKLVNRAPSGKAATQLPNWGSAGVSVGALPIAPGADKAEQILPAKKISTTSSGIAPRNFGTLNHPFTTARVAVSGANPAVKYPYRAAGKLFFKDGATSYVCSASIIKPRVVVTAAHCVSEFGQSRFYNSFVFVPGYTNGNGAKWTSAIPIVMTSYFNGTETCTVPGVVCPNDVAVLVMNDKTAGKIGDVNGYYGYAWGGYGYTTFLGKTANQLTQLGYPVALDNGALMQRNDSLSYIDPANSNNQIIGSLMTGGSSGGPWIVNFGLAPSAPSISAGQAPNSSIVVGTTSWGYVNSALKQQGASPFTSNNIVPLVDAACNQAPGNC